MKILCDRKNSETSNFAKNTLYVNFYVIIHNYFIFTRYELAGGVPMSRYLLPVFPRQLADQSTRPLAAVAQVCLGRGHLGHSGVCHVHQEGLHRSLVVTMAT